MPSPRPLYLTNTMGRRVERFEPLDPSEVRVYSCGPTVYSYAHIGNFRAFIFADTLRRVLEYNGYSVSHVRNITDVGHLTNDTLGTGLDKIEEVAMRENATPWDIAAYYVAEFQRDAQRLNLRTPTHEPRATDFVQKMIFMIERLIADGFAYESSGNVYFSVSKFPGYGLLSGNTVTDLVEGARVEVGEGKRAAADFALWKAAEPNKIMRWSSPWGDGVPGWHIECSAMSMDLLGEQVDIHTGAVDNIFPHHEDEIAQSESATRKRFVRYWMHNAFLEFADGAKMAKSTGNIYTISDLIREGINPLSYRYFSYQAHYRTPLRFSFEALGAAQTALFRLYESAAELVQSAQTGTVEGESIPYQAEFHESVNQDLDMPRAVATVHNMVASKLPSEQKLALLQDFDRILALDILQAARSLIETSPEDDQLLVARQHARATRDWPASDRLRDELRLRGLEVKDSATGQKWTRPSVLVPQVENAK